MDGCVADSKTLGSSSDSMAMTGSLHSSVSLQAVSSDSAAPLVWPPYTSNTDTFIGGETSVTPKSFRDEHQDADVVLS